VAFGAMAVYYTSCILQGLSPTLPGALLLFLYFFSMYLWNSLASIENTKHLGLSRYRFYHANKKALYTVAAVTIALLIAISSAQSKFLFYLLLFSIVAGSVYHMTIVPPFLRTITRYKSLKDIPTSRDLFVALSWAILITFIPQVIRGGLTFTLSTWFCFMLFFIQSFLRSLIFDLRDIEGDRIMGRETLITIIGESKVKTAIFIVIVGSIAVLMLYPFIISSAYRRLPHSIHTAAFVAQCAPFFYVLFFMFWNKTNKVSRSIFFNGLADAQFYISGLCAWIVSAIK
jgi:4-hydroxy-3-methylbut-2-enyl diphosphate reductase